MSALIAAPATTQELAPRELRAAVLAGLRDAVGQDGSEADRVLLDTSRLLEATFAEGLWLDDHRLSPWGGEVWPLDHRFVSDLESAASGGVLVGQQAEAADSAVQALVIADLALVENERLAAERAMMSLGCQEDPEAWTCKKIFGKLDESEEDLLRARVAIEEGQPALAMDQLRIGWKRSLKGQRKHLASSHDAERMLARLEEAIQGSGCAGSSEPIDDVCSELQKRLARARGSLAIAESMVEEGRFEKAEQRFARAWKQAWSAIWELLPPGSGYEWKSRTGDEGD